jgi:hypothetical protein
MKLQQIRYLKGQIPTNTSYLLKISPNCRHSSSEITLRSKSSPVLVKILRHQFLFFFKLTQKKNNINVEIHKIKIKKKR